MVWLFWIVAGGLTAAAAALVAVRAGAAAGGADGSDDPALGVYRRQLAELDDLKGRGLLGVEEHRAAFAEAGRRLLSESERVGAAEVPGGRTSAGLVLGGVGAATLAALALYLLIGSPGFSDQPYAARLTGWRSGDPTRLKPAEVAAVLRELAAERPGDPQAQEFLGRAELGAGDPIAAAQAFQKAVRASPDRAELHVRLGEALVAAAGDGPTPPEAQDAFRRAIALDPGNLPARYMLARAQVADGDRAAGLAALRSLEAELPAGDPRRALVSGDIAQASGVPSGPEAEAVLAAGKAEQATFIQAMVTRLAARLEANPDDVDGWARMVRAYKVLGDATAGRRALEQARKQFAGRPADLARIEAEASPAPP